MRLLWSCRLEKHVLVCFLPGGPCQLPRTACGYAAHRRELPALQTFWILSREALPASPVSVRLCRPLPGTPYSSDFCRASLQGGPASFPGQRAAMPPAAGNSLPWLQFQTKKNNIYIYIFQREIYIYIYKDIYMYIYPFSTLAVSFLRSLLSELRQTSQATRKLAGVAPEHLSPCFSSHAVSFQQSC